MQYIEKLKIPGDIKTLDDNYNYLLLCWEIKKLNSSGVDVFKSSLNVSRKYEQYLILDFWIKKNVVCSLLLEISQTFPEHYSIQSYLDSTQVLFDQITQYKWKTLSIESVFWVIIKHVQQFDFYKENSISLQKIFQHYQYTFNIKTTRNKTDINSILQNIDKSKEFCTENSIQSVQEYWLKIQAIVEREEKVLQKIFPQEFLDTFKKYHIEDVNFSFLHKKIFPYCKTVLQEHILKLKIEEKEKKRMNNEIEKRNSLRKILFLTDFIIRNQ